jgi:hypothetical protein
MPPEVNVQCQFYEACKADREQLNKERIAHAEFTGSVLATLKNLEGSVKDIWDAVNDGRKDVKDLYFKVGLISGGTSLIVSLIVSFIVKAVV